MIPCLLGGVLLQSVYANALTDEDDLTVKTTIAPYVAIEVGVDKGEDYKKILDLGTISPSPNGTFASNKIATRVYTNASDGYQLKLQDQDANNAMAHTEPSVSSSIKAVSGTVTGVNNLGTGFPVNSWGYALGEFADASTKLDFLGVPTTSETAATLKQVNTLPENGFEDTTVTFALKADYDLVAGMYEDMVVFTASVNLEESDPGDDAAFYTITDMQEMTPEVCASVATPSVSDADVPQTVLTDTRDGKKYTVSKLADGGCWMSDYLAYDLKAGDTFTPSDTDVQSDWSAASAGVTIVGDVKSGAWPNDKGLRYYGQSQTNGNLYNWAAATLGSGLGKSSGEAPASICPAGWQIPSEATLSHLVLNVSGLAAKHSSDPDFGTLFGMEDPDSADLALLQNGPIKLTPTNYYTSSGFDNGENISITQLWTSTLESANGPYALLLHGQLNLDEGYMLAVDMPATSATSYSDGYAVRCVAK